MLAAQKAAAYTYQERGEAEPLPRKGSKKKSWFYYARAGGSASGDSNKATIWGWGKLAKIARRNTKFQPVFYEARFNHTYSRYREALKQKQSADKKKLLQRAKDEIRLMYLSYSELGGATWRSKFESLLRDIQNDLRQPPIGFEEFQ